MSTRSIVQEPALCSCPQSLDLGEFQLNVDGLTGDIHTLWRVQAIRLIDVVAHELFKDRLGFYAKADHI